MITLELMCSPLQLSLCNPTVIRSTKWRLVLVLWNKLHIAWMHTASG